MSSARDAQAWAASFLRELEPLAKPGRAEFEKNYLKSKRQHLGVPFGEIDKALRRTVKGASEQELYALADALWRSDVFEGMIASGRILAHKAIPPSPKLWKTVVRYLKRDVDGWALEDNLAKAGWKCLLADPALLDEVEAWTRHKDFWIRRAALIFTLPFAKQGHDPARMLGWMAVYADDPEWFIQKAIGWWLRDLSAHNPEAVVGFLNAHRDQLRAVAKKEGARKLAPDWRKRLK